MIQSRGADLAFILADCGTTATVGSHTAGARLSAADGFSPAEGDSPVRVVERAVRITIVTGSLGTLTPGSAIVVNGGDLAGTYTIDHSTRSADGAQTEIIAR